MFVQPRHCGLKMAKPSALGSHGGQLGLPRDRAQTLRREAIEAKSRMGPGGRWQLQVLPTKVQISPFTTAFRG